MRPEPPEPPDRTPDILDTPEAGPAAVRGGMLRIAGYSAGVVVGVASSAVLFRHLGVVDGGRYVTVLALMAIAIGVSDLGLTGLGVREYTIRDGEARRRFMRNLLGMRLAYTGIALAGALLFAVLAGYTEAMIVGAVPAGIGLLLYVLQQTFTIPLQVRLRLGWVTLLQFLAQAGMATGIVALSVAGAGLVPLLAVQVPVMVPIIALTLWLVREQIPVAPAFEWDEWRKVVRDTVAYSVAVVFAVLYFRLVAILTQLLSTEEQTGYFAVAFRVLDSLTLMPPLLAAAAFPILARASRDDTTRLDYALRRLSEAMLIGGVGLALTLVIGAPVAIDIVAGSDFEASVEVLRILGPAIAGTFLIATWGLALLSIHEHRALLVSNVIAVCVATVLSAVLIPADGARGAALSLTITELTLAAAYGVALARARPALIAAAGIAPRVLLAATIGAAVAVVPGLPALPAAVVAGLVYVGVLALLRAIPWEIADAFRRAGPGNRPA